MNESNYRNSDPVLQPLGRAIPIYGHHVITIPQDLLTSGSCQLTVITNAGIVKTTFFVP